MKRLHWLFLIALLGGGAYIAARQMHPGASGQPSWRTEKMAMPPTAEDGLLWLKTEFHLSEADYERIRELHEGYLPGCAERCQEIARVRGEMLGLITKSKAVTPEIKSKLDEAARLRARCSEMMLAHFYQVAAAMPPAAASRYLEWVTRETLMD
jgi:hypothetical protein